MPSWVSMMNNVDKVHLTGVSMNIVAANTVQTIYDHSQHTAYHDSFNTYTSLNSNNRPQFGRVGARRDQTPSQEETSYAARKKKKKKNRRKPKSPQNFDDGSGSANDPFEKSISNDGGSNWHRDNRPPLSEVQDEGAMSGGEDFLCHSMENMGFNYRSFPTNSNCSCSSPPARHKLPAHCISNIGPNPLDAASVVYLDNKISTINFKSGNTTKQKIFDSFNDSSITRISRKDVRQ